MNTARKAQLLGQILVRNLSRTAVKNEKTVEVTHPKFKKLKEIQKKYTVDDGIPSYLKGGFSDTLLYQFTLILTLIATGMSVETLYSLSFPKKD